MKKLSTDYGLHLSLSKYHSQETSPSSLSSPSSPLLLSPQSQSQPPPPPPSSPSSSQLFPKEGFLYSQILGNFHNSFIVLSYNSNIYLIDQHAASQKTLYTRLLHEEPILPYPYTGPAFQLDNLYRRYLQNEKTKIQMQNKGWTYQILGGGPVFIIVQLIGVPGVGGRVGGVEDFMLLVEDGYERGMEDKEANGQTDINIVGNGFEGQEEEREVSRSQRSAMADIACHNAYRIGDLLGRGQMRDLVDTLYEIDGAYNCPHNRPIIVMLASMKNIKTGPGWQRKYSLY